MKQHAILVMVDWSKHSFGIAKIVTYVLLVITISLAFIIANFRFYTELDGILLLLVSYTLLLVLPISDFDFGWSGFKGKILRKEVDELTQNIVTESVLPDTTKVEQKICTSAIPTTDDDIIFMKLMSEIQHSLDSIALSSGIPKEKYGIGPLIRQLETKGILTEQWLLNSLFFLRDRRNDLMHLRKRNDITQKAIFIEKAVLARLLEIKKEYEEK